MFRLCCGVAMEYIKKVNPLLFKRMVIIPVLSAGIKQSSPMMILKILHQMFIGAMLGDFVFRSFFGRLCCIVL